MGPHRSPDNIPYADGDIPEEYDGAKIIYIERPARRNDSIGHIMQALTLAILMGLTGFVWRYTVTNESRLTVLEVQSVYFKERLADLVNHHP
jgi:hypothetical protein